MINGVSINYTTSTIDFKAIFSPTKDTIPNDLNVIISISL